ncbi:unnamed protein product [Malus baccata var. baccata]
MAADTQQWVVEQPQSRSAFEMSNGSPYVAVQQPLQAACSICNMITPDFMSCPQKDVYPDFTAEQVNAFNNFQRPIYDPYSNFYNPGWRDHPNLKWDKDQHSRPQFQQQVQQLAAPKAAWEVAIEKLANTTTQEIQNLQATVKNMEKQMGHIALQVSGRAPGTFPSQTKPNPMGGADCKAVRDLRSGKSFDNRDENCVQNSRINLPLIDAIKNIPSYAKFFKDVCTKKKKLVDFEKRLGQREIKPTSVILQLADRSVAYLRGIIEDLIVKVDNLYLSADFVILDMDEDMQTPIILGRLFMATARTLIDVEAGTLTLRVQDQSVVFSLFKATKRPDSSLPIIIVANLSSTEEDKLLRILRSYQDAIGWTIADIKGISPTIFMHKILLEDGVKLVIDAQHCLNPIMKEVVRNEVMKLLDAGMIYPISDSKWISPTQVVPKRSGITVVKNDNNELVPTRLTTGWRMCVDYRKINAGYNQISVDPED